MYYDLSDCELEACLRYNLTLRWFCGFVVEDETPDHTCFCRIRKILSTGRIGLIFRKINRRRIGLSTCGNFLSKSDLIQKNSS
ncbi:transposase [bacterium]|nr:transposase [bacterium]